MASGGMVYMPKANKKIASLMGDFRIGWHVMIEEMLSMQSKKSKAP